MQSPAVAPEAGVASEALEADLSPVVALDDAQGERPVVDSLALATRLILQEEVVVGGRDRQVDHVDHGSLGEMDPELRAATWMKALSADRSVAGHCAVGRVADEEMVFEELSDELGLRDPALEPLEGIVVDQESLRRDAHEDWEAPVEGRAGVFISFMDPPRRGLP